MTAVGLPVAHVLFARLPSRGYLLAKPLGLLLFSFAAWLPLYTGLVTNGQTYLLAVLGIGLLAALEAQRRMPGLLAGLRERRWQVLAGEVVFAVAFVLFALYRARNPDIVGTEKPMEFAMLSTVMRSPSLPPADPWMAGLPVNYYYFGYFIYGALGNLAGTALAVAFNLAVTSIFGLVALVAYSLGGDLLGLARAQVGVRARNFAGLLAAVFTLVAGNLTAYRLITEPDLHNQDFWRGIGWNASRVLQRTGDGGELQDYTINEFPAFSFILGDLHPHVMALPFTLLAAALALAWLLAWTEPEFAYRNTIPLAIGAAVLLGALNVMNPWDYPSFALLIGLAGAAGLVFFGDRARWIDLVIHMAAVVALSLLLYLPYHRHFEPFISQFGRVEVRSAVGPFVVIFGLWIVAALGLAAYRLGRGRRADRWVLLVVVVLTVILWLSDVPATVLVMCLLIAATMAFVGVRRSGAGQPGRLALPFLFFAGFGLAAVPELVFVDDFFGPPYERMNTVFKIYFQAWPLLAVASAPAIFLLLRRGWARGVWRKHEWPRGAAASPLGSGLMFIGGLLVILAVLLLFGGQPLPWRSVTVALVAAVVLQASINGPWEEGGAGAWTAGFTVVVIALFFVAMIYPVAAGKERMQGNAYATLDGLDYARRIWPAEVEAAEWLRANAPDDAVVLEAAGTAYSDFAHVSAWTGIPTVIGWDQHEGLWRGDRLEVDSRIVDVDAIYQGLGMTETLQLLEKYNVRYVYVGRMEMEKYGPAVATRFSGFPLLFEVRGAVSVFGVPLSTPAN